LKLYFSILLIFSLSIKLLAQEHIDSYFLSIKNIMNYNTHGYQVVTKEGILTYREALSINDYARWYFAIRPYDVFIKCYEKNTKEVYYTRNTDTWLAKDGYIHINHQFVLNELPAPLANTFIPREKNSANYIIMQYRPQPIILDKDDLGYEVIHEFKLYFYKQVGNITKNIDNIFFQFDSVDRTGGHLEYNTMDLSNADLSFEISNLRLFVGSIESNEIREKYIEKLNSVDAFLNSDPYHFIYRPQIIKSIISQFYSMEIIKNIWCRKKHQDAIYSNGNNK